MSAPDSKGLNPKSSMAKHHDYKADVSLLYNRPCRELICYWVVQYDREPWARQYDYLASLTIIVEEEVSCLLHHYHGQGDTAHQRRLINVKTLVSTTQSRATQTRVQVKVVSHSSPAC